MSNQQLLYTNQIPGRTLLADGKEYLFFSGTSYLGILCNQEFQQHLHEGFQKYGTNYSSSRNSNLQLRVFDEVETYLATFTGAEAALTMSSGFMAGQALVHILQNSGHFIYAPDTHPALWRSLADAPTNKLTYDEWATNLAAYISAIPDDQILIVCNSLDPLRARSQSFSWLNTLPSNKKITLIIDDSHGLGVTGVEGAGIYSLLPDVKEAPHIRLLVVGSLGKAFGIPAGVVLGDVLTTEQLKRSPYFGGASPAIPAYMFAFLHSKSLYAQARERLACNINQFLKQLAHPKLFSFLESYPVFYTSQKGLCPFLLDQDIMISSFRYPTPADEPITRVVLNSLHSPDDISKLTEAINKYSFALHSSEF